MTREAGVVACFAAKSVSESIENTVSSNKADDENSSALTIPIGQVRVTFSDDGRDWPRGSLNGLVRSFKVILELLKLLVGVRSRFVNGLEESKRYQLSSSHRIGRSRRPTSIPVITER